MTSEEQELEEPSVADVPEPDQELDEHEAEDTEDMAEREGHTTEEPEPAQAVSPETWEKRWKAADRAFATYSRKVSDIFEEEAVNLSPFSISPSAPPGFVYAPDAGRVPEEIVSASMEFFGLAREQDYEADPETETCRSCKGKGKTKTGSTVGGQEARPCPTCKGYGYTLQGRAPSEQASQGNGASAELAEGIGPLVQEDVDAWEQPRVLPDGRLNPNYGRMPQYWEKVEPWGETRGLKAQDAVA